MGFAITSTINPHCFADSRMSEMPACPEKRRIFAEELELRTAIDFPCYSLTNPELLVQITAPST
jgi:hypothetical protein